MFTCVSGWADETWRRRAESPIRAEPLDFLLQALRGWRAEALERGGSSSQERQMGLQSVA